MVTTVTRDDEIVVSIDDPGGDRPRGCQWDESVCTAAPDHRVVRGADDEAAEPSSDVDVYCARHYALELARLTEVHLHDCASPASHHVSHFGRVGS